MCCKFLALSILGYWISNLNAMSPAYPELCWSVSVILFVISFFSTNYLSVLKEQIHSVCNHSWMERVVYFCRIAMKSFCLRDCVYNLRLWKLLHLQ